MSEWHVRFLRVMQTARFAALVIILMSLSLVSVYGQGYPPSPSITKVPLLGTSGAPALAGNDYAGLITVLYADGQPVVLGSTKAYLAICSVTNSSLTGGGSYVAEQMNRTGCVSIETTLKQTAPGTYAYSFPIPALSGLVGIYVQAGGLADDNGRIFPSVDTQIGAYAAPTSSSSSAPAEESHPGTPVPQQSNLDAQPLTRQAVAAQPAGQSPIFTVAIALGVLGLAGIGLLIAPRRKNSG